ncbi:MAG: hypothetical protein A2Z71_07780 [Chloroflexi bacterium RBG_13_50_21]|nr:MAG: hypothetical protein A2Z71_07780 [Chloroflexi bacterium RBG_13_50_21]
MDNIGPVAPEQDPETKPGDQVATPPVVQPAAEAESQGYVNENITKAFGRLKIWFAQVKNRYTQSPRLQKVVYQGKFKPAFWTVTAIFSLLVNTIFIAFLILFGHYFFELKALVAGGLVTEVYNNLALMDKAHIVTTVPVNTTVQLQDNLPVVFDLAINQSTQLALAEDTQIPGAYIYLNNTPVLTDLTLPAGTPIQANLDMTIPVSQSIPVDVTVPVSLLVPLDLAIDQTDLHQSIVGLQGAIEPYKVLLASEFTSTKDFPICNQWWSGWLCSVFFGRR